MPSVRALIRNWPAWLPLALLAITILTLFHRLLAGEVIFWGLPSLQFYPWRDFTNSEIAAGRMPLWNPYNGAGAPLLANYQSAILYPPNLLYLLLPGPQTMGWLGMLHLFWAGIGMWRLTGRLDGGILGRGIATLAYPLSSTIVARFGTIPMVDVAAWLPWLILQVDILLDGTTIPRILVLAAIVAMQLLAGHAQWAYYSFIFAGGYGLWRLVSERKTNPYRRWPIIVIAGAVAVVLGVGIAAAQLAPTAELQSQSQRAGGLDEEFVLNFSYSPLSLVTLFNPNFFGNPGDGSYVIGGAYFETAAYIGVLPVCLAFVGVLHLLRMHWRRRKNLIPIEPQGANHGLIPFFALTATVSVVFAFGKFGIYALLYRYVPTFSTLQAPARWLLLTVFSLTMLAALAVPMWKPDRRARRNVRIVLIGAVSLIGAGIVAQLLAGNALPVTAQLVRGITILGVLLLAVALIFLAQPNDERRYSRWTISVLIFVAVDLWWANAQSNPTVPANFYDKGTPTTTARIFWPDSKGEQLPELVYDEYLPLNDYQAAVKRWRALKESNLPNLNLLNRQPVLNNFDPLRVAGFERYINLLNEDNDQALLRAGGAETVISSDKVSYPQQMPSRAWMVSDAIGVTSFEAAEKTMQSPGWDPSKTVALHGDVDLRFGGEAGIAQINDENPQNLVINVDSPQGGWLVVADTYYPGWQATIDDQSVPIFRANMNFRAVEMPPGTHTVRMSYRPSSWTIGLTISIISLGVLILAAAVALIQRALRRETVEAIENAPPTG